jgi:hypothetical protein
MSNVQINSSYFSSMHYVEDCLSGVNFGGRKAITVVTCNSALINGKVYHQTLSESLLGRVSFNWINRYLPYIVYRSVKNINCLILSIN